MRWLFLLVLFLAGCGETKKTLHLYNWSNFIHPDAIAQFEDKYNCRVVTDTYDSNESMTAKLIAGGGGYDVVFPTQYFVDILYHQDLIEKLDFSKISNYKNIDWEELADFHIAKTEAALPYLLTTTGIAYRADRLETPDSWNIFSDARYKGRMTLLNDVRDVLGVALLTLGYDVNSKSRDEIQKAAEIVLDWKKNIAKFDSDYKNGIASSEFLICQAYSGEVQQVIQESPEVNYSLPKEGSIVSCDMVAIPRGAPSIDLAYSFLNFLLEPSIAYLNMTYAYGNPTNKALMETLPSSFRENTLIFPSPEEAKRCYPVLDVGEATFYYNEAWTKIKTS